MAVVFAGQTASILAGGMIAFSAPPETGSQRRVDGNLKVTGAMPYAADLQVQGALHVAVVRSSRPHARILHIDPRPPGRHRVWPAC